MNLENLRQNNALLNTICIWLRIIDSCVYIFQGPVKSFIDVLNCLQNTLFVFSGFSHFWCPKPVFPRTVFTGKYHGKKRVLSKTVQPLFSFIQLPN